VGEVGELDEPPEESSQDNLPVNISPNDDYQQLNGEGSPFFQPPTSNEAR
jgi:hypothetical protein